MQANNTKNAHNELFLHEIFVTAENINIHITSKEVLNNLSVIRIWFPHMGPEDALMMQDDSRQNWPINELPVSLYNLMFTALGSSVISQCEHEPTRTKKTFFLLVRTKLTQLQVRKHT